MKKIILQLFTLFICGLCWSQSGTLDPGFGSGGFILTPPQLPLQPGQSFAKQCFVRADNKIDLVVFGTKTQICRRLPGGQLDSTYAYKGYSQVASMIPTCAAIQQDGKIVVGGSASGFGNFVIARYQVSGNLDSSFGNGGIAIAVAGASEFLNAIVISPAGKIIAGGSSVNGGVSLFTLVQFTGDGVLDASFGTGGIATTAFNGNSASIAALATQADGKIVAAGSVYMGLRDFALARYNADGSADLTLNGTGYVSTDFGFDDAAQSVVTDGGKIYLGGFSSDASGFQHFRIARYNGDGSPDASYNGGSLLADFGNSHDVLISMKLQDDGKIVASGRTDLFSANNDAALIRVNTNGVLDSSFGSSGNGLAIADLNGRADETVYITIRPDGKILTGGDSQDFSSSPFSVFTCFRFNANGTLDAGFGTNGAVGDGINTAYESYTSVLDQPAGSITAVSTVSSGNVSRSFANRFKANGTPDSSFGRNGVKQIGSSSGSVYLQPDGKFLEIDFTVPAQMIRYNADGSLDAGFGNAGVVQIAEAGFPAFQPDGKIVLGGFVNTSGNNSDFLIARYNPDGSVDPTFGNAGFTQFNADTIDNLNTISIAPDGKIIAGGTGYIFPPDFSFFQAEVVVLRLNADGTPDTGFGDGGLVRVFRGDNDYIGVALAQNDNKVVLSYAVTDNTTYQTNFFLKRLNADGTADNTFGENGQTSTNGVNFLFQADQKIVLSGTVTNNEDNKDFSLTRFNTDGSTDPGFGSGGQVISSFTGVDNNMYTLSRSADSLFVGGNGVDKTGAGYSILAKYLLEAAASVTCPVNMIVNTDSNKCSAIVTGIDPASGQSAQTVKYTLTGATTAAGSGSASGKTFNKGVTTVMYMLTADTTKSCSFTITVEDKQPPVISSFSVSPATLFLRDHRMREVTVNYSVADNCGIENVELSVTSNEPVQSNEKGDRSPDWQILDDHHIRLRAESLSDGNGRIYIITLTVTDVSGNKTMATATVNVPKSAGPRDCNLQLTASPNPTHSYFIVSVNSKCMGKIKIRLLNILGNVLTTWDDVTPPRILKFGAGLQPGIYFLEAIQPGNVQALELLKL